MMTLGQCQDDCLASDHRLRQFKVITIQIAVFIILYTNTCFVQLLKKFLVKLC